jgi:GntR family transcriptional regulator/MocR family aminotransferase
VVTRPASPVVSIRLDRDGPTGLAVQISGQVRVLIRNGALGTGARLPSTRALAVELGVARGVVEQAFDQLVAEGWLQSRRGSGTYVAAGVAEAGAATTHLGIPGRPAAGRRSAAEPIVLDTGTPWVDRRHEAAWRRAWRTVGASVPPARYPDPAGLPALRAAVADYVGRQRGMACSTDNVLITNGTAHGLALLLDVLPAGPVALEDPGYRAAAATIEASGRAVVDIPGGDDGLNVPSLAEARQLRAVYVTPAHQHPLGMPMSAATRVALLAEASRRDLVVIEDDYDSEFRYDVAPLPALAQLDSERVVYLGTTSKTLTPALRIGWLVATPNKVDEIARRREARHDHPTWPMQRALLALFDEGYLDRQVRSARRLYAERSRLLRHRLAPYGSTGASVAGMYVTLQTRPEVAASVVASAARQSVVIPSLADYCRSSSLAGLVVGFGGVSDAEFEHALGILEAALATATEHTGPVA